jgi:hypothetical protein
MVLKGRRRRAESTLVAIRRITLRRPGTCAVCRAPVEAGNEAWWNPDRQTVMCPGCADGGAVLISSGVAGGSARAQAERLRAGQRERHATLKKERPVVGRILLAVKPEPEAGASWAKGAAGEVTYGTGLDRLAADGVLRVLHDRRIPRSKANLDHLVVTSNGVWVVDTKRYRAARVGKTVGTDGPKLVVDGRTQTRLVLGVRRQTDLVRAALPGCDEVPVRGALCFVDAEFSLFAKPFTIDDVVVSWGRALNEKHLLAPGPFDGDDRAALHRHLARSFPPAE